MAPVILSALAFAALVAAIPKHSDHLGKAQAARGNQIFARSDEVGSIAGRTISYDGSCGSWSGYTCPAGNCCSAEGWCGNTSIHCGTGCQSGFGQCGSGDSAPPPASSATTSSTTVAPAATSPNVVDAVKPPPPPSTTSSSAAASTTTAAAESQAAGSGGTTTENKAVSNSGSSSGLGDTYTKYTGDGSAAAGWPDMSEWVDFETSWSNNQKIIGCDKGEQNTPTDTANLKSAIQSVAGQTGVDARFILAIVMQESKGCVRVESTAEANGNPGLMQSHAGQGTCENQSDCSASEITLMINDGVTGTSSGKGLEQLGATGTNDASNYYKAARLYNSGENSSTADLSNGGSTSCYCSDVANRLTGWVSAPNTCGN